MLSDAQWKNHIVFFFTPRNWQQTLPPALYSPEKVIRFVNHIMQENPATKDSLTREIAEEFIDSKANSEYVFYMDKYHNSSKRLCVIGDAAHTMSSALGQVTSMKIF